MGNHAAKNALLVILAMVLGLTLGAVTKFGFAYELSLDTASPRILATK
jgi:hypothetical protein